MTFKITREFELDNIGQYLLDYFLETHGYCLNCYEDEDIYFDQIDHFQQIEVLKAIKEQFSNAIDDEIKDIKEKICNR